MTNKDLIESTKDIVIAMINNNLITASSKDKINDSITTTIEKIYTKLEELNSKTITIGKISKN